jgi:hypothetical protein
MGQLALIVIHNNFHKMIKRKGDARLRGHDVGFIGKISKKESSHPPPPARGQAPAGIPFVMEIK